MTSTESNPSGMSPTDEMLVATLREMCRSHEAKTHYEDCWKVHKDCAALFAAERIEELATALREARTTVEDWAMYAPEWAREKWDLASDLAAIDAVLGDEPTREEVT